MQTDATIRMKHVNSEPTHVTTIYQNLLKHRIDLLSHSLRQFLSQDSGQAAGRMTVTRAPGWIRGFTAWALGIPPADEYDLALEVTPHGAGQRWARHFGKYSLTTTQYAWRELLIERKGLASLGFDLLVQGERLLFKPRRAWVLGVRVPLWLSPQIDAENWPGPAGGWHVRVAFRVPLLGQVAEYEGEVRAVEN